MEIPELEIKNSKLAEKIISILQREDKFDLAHKMVAIADESIKNQLTRDIIDLSIEMARVPNIPLGRNDIRKLKCLLLEARQDLEELKNSVSDGHFLLNYLSSMVEDLIDRIPRTVPEMVLEKLRDGEVRTPPPLSSHWMRFMLYRLQDRITSVCKIIPEKNAERLRKTFGKIAEIVGFPLKGVV